MAGSQDQPSPPAIPSWQHAAVAAASTPDSSSDPSSSHDDAREHRLDVARRFLDADDVKSASRDKKADFLRSKGIDDADIQTLLPELPPDQAARDSPVIETEHVRQGAALSPPPSAAAPHPPVVTYPEFLTKPQRPPPLVTRDGLLNTLYAFAGLSALLYGTSKYVVAPMVESLTAARADLYDTSSARLDALVAKLERSVSVIPPSTSAASASALVAAAAADHDAASDVEDPSEMFHRDVGTQTTFLPVSPRAPAPAPATPPTDPESSHQADRLIALTKTLSALKDQFRTQSEDMDDIRTLLDVFRDDLDGMTYGGHTHFVGGYDMYGTAKKSEPEDEIRKVRDNIRRVKGVLLSTRNFPASAR